MPLASLDLLAQEMVVDLRLGIDAFVAEVIRRFEVALARFSVDPRSGFADFLATGLLESEDAEFLAHQAMFRSTITETESNRSNESKSKINVHLLNV